MTKWWGGIKAVHYDKLFPYGAVRTSVELAKGMVFGPIVNVGTYGRYTTVEMPFKGHGLRWINIVVASGQCRRSGALPMLLGTDDPSC